MEMIKDFNDGILAPEFLVSRRTPTPQAYFDSMRTDKVHVDHVFISYMARNLGKLNSNNLNISLIHILSGHDIVIILFQDDFQYIWVKGNIF